MGNIFVPNDRYEFLDEFCAKVLKEILEQSIKASDFVINISESSKEQTKKVLDIEGLINSIKTASTEQTHGVAQINIAISSMDNSIQTSTSEVSITRSASFS